MVEPFYLILCTGSNKTEVRDKSVNGLIDELKRCEQLGIPYLVLHPGASTGGVRDTILLGRKLLIFLLDRRDVFKTDC